MFGYIAPCRPELRIREEKEYKAWYCGYVGSWGIVMAKQPDWA